MAAVLATRVAGDLADIASTAAARRGLPDGSLAATVAVAGASALLTLALATTTSCGSRWLTTTNRTGDG